MNAFKVLRATTSWGDAAWAVALAAIGALIGLIGAIASDDASLAAIGSKIVPLIGLPIMFRYQFGSARAVLFWFDSARQAVPGVSHSSIAAEALRFFLMLGVLGGAMAFASWLAPGAVSPSLAAKALAVTLVASVIGALAAVMPYRWMPVMMLLFVGLVVLLASGRLPKAGWNALLVATAIFGAGLVLVSRRLQALLRKGVDPAVGGDYAFVFSFGRHAGSVFDAPNSAPLAVLLRERRQRERAASLATDRLDSDSRVNALFGEQAWQRATAPSRHWLAWAGLMLSWPALMLGVFALIYTLNPGKHSLSEMVALLLVLVFVLWGFVINGAVQVGRMRRLASELRETGALHAELRLLPGIAVQEAAWNRRLRPLWLPENLGMTFFFMVIAAFAGVAPLGIAFLGGVGLLEAARIRTLTHAMLFGAAAARRFSEAAGTATGLAFVAGPMIWFRGVSPELDKLFGQIADALGVEPVLPLGVLIVVAAVLQCIAHMSLSTARDQSLMREAMVGAP